MHQTVDDGGLPRVAIRAFRADLRQLEREVERSLASETGCCGVTSAQCHLLLEVDSRAETDITALAGVLELDKSTLSRTVDGMCRGGLLNRETDPDNRRRQVISLTAEGRKKADAIHRLCDGSYRRLLERIPPDKRAMVVQSVSLLASAMRELRTGTGRPCCGDTNEGEGTIMILKSCIGNRSLGWDLLPPDSKGYEFTDKDRKTGKEVVYTYAGYKESPMRWEKGTEPQKIGWYAGKQYDDDTANAKKVLQELDKYYPGATKYEIAGFFFWQGDKDRYDAGLASHYEQNLVQLIKQLRKDFNAPNARFVCATLGQTAKGDKTNSNEANILEAQLAVDGHSGKYPEFKGNVATVYSHPLSLGGASNGHYNGNAETYMNIGEAMGKAMVELLKDKK